MADVKVRIPLRLMSHGKGVLAFSIQLVNGLYSGYEGSCRIEGVSDSGGCKTYGKFLQSGSLQLTLPGDVGGELTPIIEFTNERKGKRLIGSFQLRIDHHESGQAPNIHIVQSGEAGVVYAPGVGVPAERKSVEIVGDSVIVTVPLFAEDSGEHVPLERLLERHQVVVLPERVGRPIRSLQVHVGKRLALGRCYADQLKPKAAKRFEDAQAGRRVSWVTHWDDASVNQLSALLSYSPSPEQLHIESLTDYSQQGATLLLCDEECRETAIAPGKAASYPVSGESDISLCVGKGSARRVLVRLDFENVPLAMGSQGDETVAIPVFRTHMTEFLFPPGGGAESRRVAFLGIWIPLEPWRLKEQLVASGEDLSIEFPEEQVYLWLSASRGSRSVEVSSNVGIKDCLGG